MLVESPDGQRALLGRNKKFTAGMYTCLSGFIDQCESIEEVRGWGRDLDLMMVGTDRYKVCTWV